MRLPAAQTARNCISSICGLLGCFVQRQRELLVAMDTRD
jgi:hypothetical protein